jgi:formylmethanofuran dehydrogenase subunit E
MSIMGARLGLAAAAVVGRHGTDGDVTALYLNRNCGLDGIQAALGTTLGNGNIQVDPQGLTMLEARNEDTGKRVRVTLTEAALALGRRYGELRKAGTGEVERLEILLRLQSAPDEEIVEVAVME